MCLERPHSTEALQSRRRAQQHDVLKLLLLLSTTPFWFMRVAKEACNWSPWFGRAAMFTVPESILAFGSPCTGSVGEHLQATAHDYLGTWARLLMAKEPFISLILWLQLPMLLLMCLVKPNAHFRYMMPAYGVLVNGIWCTLVHALIVLWTSAPPTAASWQHLRQYPIHRAICALLFPVEYHLEVFAVVSNSTLTLLTCWMCIQLHPSLAATFNLPSQLITIGGSLAFSLLVAWLRKPSGRRIRRLAHAADSQTALGATKATTGASRGDNAHSTQPDAPGDAIFGAPVLAANQAEDTSSAGAACAPRSSATASSPAAAGRGIRALAVARPASPTPFSLSASSHLLHVLPLLVPRDLKYPQYLRRLARSTLVLYLPHASPADLRPGWAEAVQRELKAALPGCELEAISACSGSLCIVLDLYKMDVLEQQQQQQQQLEGAACGSRDHEILMNMLRSTTPQQWLEWLQLQGPDAPSLEGVVLQVQYTDNSVDQYTLDSTSSPMDAHGGTVWRRTTLSGTADASAAGQSATSKCNSGDGSSMAYDSTSSSLPCCVRAVSVTPAVAVVAPRPVGGWVAAASNGAPLRVALRLDCPSSDDAAALLAAAASEHVSVKVKRQALQPGDTEVLTLPVASPWELQPCQACLDTQRKLLPGAAGTGAGRCTCRSRRPTSIGCEVTLPASFDTAERCPGVQRGPQLVAGGRHELLRMEVWLQGSRCLGTFPLVLVPSGGTAAAAAMQLAEVARQMAEQGAHEDRVQLLHDYGLVMVRLEAMAEQRREARRAAPANAAEVVASIAEAAVAACLLQLVTDITHDLLVLAIDSSMSKVAEVLCAALHAGGVSNPAETLARLAECGCPSPLARACSAPDVDDAIALVRLAVAWHWQAGIPCPWSTPVPGSASVMLPNGLMVQTPLTLVVCSAPGAGTLARHIVSHYPSARALWWRRPQAADGSLAMSAAEVAVAVGRTYLNRLARSEPLAAAVRLGICVSEQVTALVRGAAVMLGHARRCVFPLPGSAAAEHVRQSAGRRVGATTQACGLAVILSSILLILLPYHQGLPEGGGTEAGSAVWPFDQQEQQLLAGALGFWASGVPSLLLYVVSLGLPPVFADVREPLCLAVALLRVVDKLLAASGYAGFSPTSTHLPLVVLPPFVHPRRALWAEVWLDAIAVPVCEQLRIELALLVRLAELVVTGVRNVQLQVMPTLLQCWLRAAAVHGCGLLVAAGLHVWHRARVQRAYRTSAEGAVPSSPVNDQRYAGDGSNSAVEEQRHLSGERCAAADDNTATAMPGGSGLFQQCLQNGIVSAQCEACRCH